MHDDRAARLMPAARRHDQPRLSRTKSLGGPLAIRYLAAPRTAEVVVVGGGIVGAATAFHAARAGLRPLLLERRPALCSLTTAVAAGGFRLQLETREQLELVRESAELFLHFAEITGQRDHD